MTTKEFPLVYVEWEDSASEAHWVDGESFVPSLSKCYTVGFLVCDKKKFLTVTSSIAQTGQFLDPITIPRACITRIRSVSKVNQVTYTKKSKS